MERMCDIMNKHTWSITDVRRKRQGAGTVSKQGLVIIMDRAGTGKSGAILNRIAEQGLSGRQLLLVPEHASHQVERDLCAVCGDHASRHASAASFRWLAADVLARTGGVSGTVLDGGGKILTMYRALQKQLPALKVYRRPSQKAAFLEQLLHLYDELRSYSVSFEALLAQKDAVSPPLGDKLQDIAVICSTYEAMLTAGGRDCRDLMDRLLDVMDCPAGQAYFRDLQVYADGFLYFNTREEEVLRRILRYAGGLTVSLLGDRERTGGIFDLSQQVRGRLIRMAEEENVPCRTIASPAAAEDAMDPALRHLERGFFGVLRPFEGENHAVRLCQGRTAYDEVTYAAAEIRRLVASGQYRYRDILVAARNMPDYEATIENVFERYAIPAFLNRSRDILEKPVIALVTAALDTVSGGWEYEDLFRYLKTGMAGLTHDQCDALENYVLKWEIHGSLWTRDAPWTAHPDGYHEEMDDSAAARLQALNETRALVRDPLLRFARRLRQQKTARGQVEALYAFLTDIALPEQLREKTAAFRNRGENKLAEEYAQIWKLLCDVMDQFVFLLDEEALDTEEFSRLLKIVLTQYDIGTIPAALDQVSVTEITRNDRHSTKCAFLLGANDHVLPAAGSPGGILTDSDRAELLRRDLRMAPFGAEQMNMEQMHLYAALAQATDRLYVSWAAADLGGTALRPAFVVGRIRRLFPELTVLQPEEETLIDAPVPALEAAGRHPSGAMWMYFAEDPALRPALLAMERGRTMERGSLSRDVVRTLYGDHIRMSASRIDQINTCHFSFFMNYGLRAKERRAAGLDAPEIGTFLHYLLENTAKEAKKRGGFSVLSQEELHGIVERYIDRFAAEVLGGLEEKSARFRYLFKRLKKTAWAIVDNVAAELAASDFVPMAFELSFGEGKAMPAISIQAKDTALTVSGKVDRVDGWMKDGKLYLRVVDYKTGRKKFDFSEILHGVNIQLLLYLFALEKEGLQAFSTGAEEVVPAGVEYLPARDVILSMDRSATPEQIAAAMEKELKRSGLFLANAEVLEAMEHGCTDKPCYLPLTVKKDGSITDGVATAAQFGKLSRYVGHLLEDIAAELGLGNIDADPNYQSESKNACVYCPFATACQFEEGRGRDRRVYLGSMDDAVFWDRMETLQIEWENGEG